MVLKNTGYLSLNRLDIAENTYKPYKPEKIYTTFTVDNKNF